MRSGRPPSGGRSGHTRTSSGFGRSIAAAALAAGDTVVATARRLETLDDLVAAYPDRAVAAQLDVTDTARIGAVVADTVLWHGRIDVVVNNAGRVPAGAAEESTDQQLLDLMDLHFFGSEALVRAVPPHMRRQRSGAIVQMNSMGGRFTFPGVGAYSASKFALEGPSEALAAEVAPHGIKALIVEPGAFRTGLAGGGALRQTAAMPVYEATVGPVRAGLPDLDGKQEGDPDKAAAAGLTALAAEKPPLRLPLGNDATDANQGHLEAARAETLAWEKVSRSTVLDG
ncbi:SDR family NAD(P)-dependent oxidoreductase [Streptomyces sp. NPDC004728]|uniref:SDR family NAD(P)-dependent oxidoreductase n=1 Tax=Streptomyces sp. NPDC004728 TaxID=3154289 RepID=UPI0033A875E3